MYLQLRTNNSYGHQCTCIFRGGGIVRTGGLPKLYLVCPRRVIFTYDISAPIFYFFEERGNCRFLPLRGDIEVYVKAYFSLVRVVGIMFLLVKPTNLIGGRD